MSLMAQRTGNSFSTRYYPFTPVTPNEPLELKVRRYLWGESEENKQERARAIGIMNEDMGIPMQDRDNPQAAAIYDQIYQLTGYRLKTRAEVLSQRFAAVGETPQVSPFAATVPLPDESGSGGEAGPSNPLSEEALKEHNTGVDVFNKPIGPLSDKSQADVDAAKSAFEGSGSDDDDEPQFEDTTSTPTPASKGKGVIRAAVAVASALTGVELEPDDDLSATIRPQDQAPTLNPAQNPYPYGTSAYFQWSPSGVANAEPPVTPTPKLKPRKPLKTLKGSPLSYARKASQAVGDSHSSEGEGDVGD